MLETDLSLEFLPFKKASFKLVGGLGYFFNALGSVNALYAQPVNFGQITITPDQFGTADLDAATRAQLERGQRISEVLKQPQYRPLPLEKQVTSMYAVINGHMDDVDTEKVQAWEEAFHQFMETNHPEILGKIVETNDLEEEAEKELVEAIDQFKKTVSV